MAWHITASLHGAAPSRNPANEEGTETRFGATIVWRETQGSGFQGRPIVPVCPERLHQHTPPFQVADRDTPVRPVCCLHTGAHHLSGNLLGPDGKAGGDADVSPPRVKEALRAVCAVKAVARHSSFLLRHRPFRAVFRSTFVLDGRKTSKGAKRRIGAQERGCIPLPCTR